MSARRDQPISRRLFLGASAKNAAGVAAGMMTVGLAEGAAAVASERVRLGVIGVRSQGKELAASFAGLSGAEIAAVCDVDESLLPAVSKAVETVQGRAPRWERDFRRLLDDPGLDAVLIATPDHWHAPMAIWACLAGKDVYVESPVSHNLREGEAMVAAARRMQRVVQTGLQQRSGAHFQSAIEFVRSGALGKVPLAKAWTVHLRKPIGQRKDSVAPAGLDYDLWLGPAPERAYNANRCHYNWHWFWDYGAGALGNWGVQMLDIARWGLNVGLPDQISATGGKHYFDDDQETPDTLMVNYSYPGRTITWEHRLWSNHGIEGRSAAAAFYGELGTLVVDRGGWKVYDQKEGITAASSDGTTAHHQSFLDCIKARRLPVADIEIGHLSSGLCHLGNIAYKTGRSLTFHTASRDFGTDREANLLLSREYRRPWELPEV